MADYSKLIREDKELEKIIKNFIIEAKINAYASGVKYKTTEDGLSEFEYTAGNYKFKDTYFGHYSFSGIEIVWHKEEPIWAMNYYGTTEEEFSKNEELTKECYTLLRKALSMVNEKNPYRGPKSIIEGEWEYKNNSRGAIDNFSGKERILYKDAEVYTLAYIGGFSKGKE